MEKPARSILYHLSSILLPFSAASASLREPFLPKSLLRRRFSAQEPARSGRNRLLAIVADGLDWTTFLGFLAKRFFFGGVWLLIDV